MNAVATPASTALAPSTASAGSLLMDMAAMERLERIADLMASGKCSVPQHLRGSKGDCFAVALQSMQWGMNPFAVAQKTHMSQSGSLGYEAQLISAVITESGAVDGDPEYEFLGDWGKILGKVEERKSDKGGKYYVATYTKADEAGLGVICRLRLKGESAPREMQVMMSQCYPRFSTQWATDPKLQICYVAIRKWSRLHKPGVILGVYTPEELTPSAELHMGPAEVVSNQPVQEPSYYPQADFDKNLMAWTKVIASGRKTLEGMYAFVESKAKLTDEQKQALADAVHKLQENTIDATPKVEQQEAEQSRDAPQIEPQKLAAEMNAAKSIDALYERATLIDAVTDPEQRKLLDQTFEAKKAELDPQ